MGYRRKDFRPDHLPPVIETRGYWTRGIAGWKWNAVSSRGSTAMRADWKEMHTRRQRGYDRKVIQRWLDDED